MNKKLNTFGKKQELVNMHNSLKVAKVDNGNYIEEYRKLRQPHPGTLLKIQGHLKNGEITKTKLVKSAGVDKHVEVPSCQELLNKAFNSNLIQNEVKKIEEISSGDSVYNLDSHEAQPLNLHTKFGLLQINKDVESKPSIQNSLSSKKETSEKTLNYIEDLLVGIFYTKVRSHPNGFFAENLPSWYKQTFDKDPSANWLDLIEASNKFILEKVENKIILYAKIKEDLNENINLNASEEKVIMTPVPKENFTLQTKETKGPPETSVNFTRYKHLKKSLEEYSKNAGNDKTKADKNKEKQTKSKIRSARGQ